MYRQASSFKGSKSNHARTRPASTKSPRIRASSLGIKETLQGPKEKRVRSVSEGEIMSKRTADEPLVAMEQPLENPESNDAVIVIDNSNVFIGAREAACALNAKLRPRHVKVRLQALAQVLENGRNVTKRFACGSSPPANEHVWDVYR